MKHDDPAHGWLGASPDGLIGGLEVSGHDGGDGEPPGPAALAALPGVRGAGVVSGAGPGILEVKCPFNKGQPERAVPPEKAIWYYMPQARRRFWGGRKKPPCCASPSALASAQAHASG